MSQGSSDSTSARAFNHALLTVEVGAIRLPAPPAPGEGGRTRLRKYIVGFHGSGSDLRGEDRAILRAAGAAERYYFHGFRATSVYLDSAAVERLRTRPAVAWIDSTDATLSPSAETTGWSYTKHGFGLAHSNGLFGHGDVRVAVIGDGVQCSLADLWCSTGVNITGDPNVDGGSGHETLIASIIAAGVGNGIGIKGGAPYVSLHSVRAANPWDHQISCLNLAEAINIATARHELDADIVNLSYSGVGITCGASVDSALANAVWGDAAIVVAAAGNQGMGQVGYPANHPLTLAVSAMKQSPFKIASFSNYGAEIDIAAGGENVKALAPNGAVNTVSGTSFAVPHVVAALALLYGQKLLYYGCKPNRYEAMAALYDNTQDPDPPIIADWYGAGALDVNAALTADWVQYVCLEW